MSRLLRRVSGRFGRGVDLLTMILAISQAFYYVYQLEKLDVR